MYYCFVCKTKCELPADLQNHMQRHLKADLINAVIKLPSDTHTTQDSHICTHCSSAPCTSECFASKTIKTEASDAETNEINNNNPITTKKKSRNNPKRSCRDKYLTNKSAIEPVSFNCIEENYYIPPSDDLTKTAATPTPTAITDESDDEISIKRLAKKITSKKKGKIEKKKKPVVEPVLTTPKIEKEPSSETDSCSGNGQSERMFCTYCGSGYRTESMLADHIRHNHLNFCHICEVNFPDLRRYKEHTLKHQIKVYVCPYCNDEFSNRRTVSSHVQCHLQESVIDDVLSLEEEYYSERTYMNTMYNMFNAGFTYGRRATNSSRILAEFYKVFLQYSAKDVDRVDRYGYLCRTCGFTLFDRSHYRDHMQIAHSVTTGDVDCLLEM
ncbi:uncharacterized protein [Atheta coriaria]|uniref:uncharacterized protein isoform X1 n=1 Tax=Dalotia coriaria TaxID=877792 RepID=UPI0031F33D8C